MCFVLFLCYFAQPEMLEQDIYILFIHLLNLYFESPRLVTGNTPHLFGLAIGSMIMGSGSRDTHHSWSTIGLNSEAFLLVGVQWEVWQLGGASTWQCRYRVPQVWLCLAGDSLIDGNRWIPSLFWHCWGGKGWCCYMETQGSCMIFLTSQGVNQKKRERACESVHNQGARLGRKKHVW